MSEVRLWLTAVDTGRSMSEATPEKAVVYDPLAGCVLSTLIRRPLSALAALTC